MLGTIGSYYAIDTGWTMIPVFNDNSSILNWQHHGRLELAHVDVNDVETLSKECDILSPNALGNVSAISEVL